VGTLGYASRIVDSVNRAVVLSCAGAILDVKPELEPPPSTVPEAVDVKKELDSASALSTLPSVFDPLPESPKEEKPILPLQGLPHPNDG
jgi:hypothetical protein